MVFLIFLKNAKRRNTEDVNNMIYTTEFYLNVGLVGDATSDFVFDRLFKLNCFETTGHTNSKLDIIYDHTKVKVIRGFDVTIEDRFFDGKNRFSAQTSAIA